MVLAAVVIGEGVEEPLQRPARDRGRDLAKVQALAAADVAASAVRADANNLWSDPDAAIAHLRSLEFPFFAIEEPLAARDYDGMRAVASALGPRMILDESALRAGELEALRRDCATWIVNVRISKMGGLLRSIEVVRRASELGLGLVIGPHVGETSVLTRAALPIADLAGTSLVAQEGAFGTLLLERDRRHAVAHVRRGTNPPGCVAWSGARIETTSCMRGPTNIHSSETRRSS